MLTPTVVREYDRNAPTSEETERATFGLGCFWGPDAAFGGLDGVVRTRVGYAGGTKADPTYHTLGDHTEVVQVDFDPDVTSYRDVVTEVFERHDPRHQTAKRQYQNVVLTESPRERELVEAVVADSGFDPDSVETRIESLSAFHVAESYHQKYNLAGTRWATEPFEKLGYDDADVRESPAAAVLNAHLAGHDVSAPFLSERPR